MKFELFVISWRKARVWRKGGKKIKKKESWHHEWWTMNRSIERLINYKNRRWMHLIKQQVNQMNVKSERRKATWTSKSKTKMADGGLKLIVEISINQWISMFACGYLEQMTVNSIIIAIIIITASFIFLPLRKEDENGSTRLARCRCDERCAGTTANQRVRSWWLSMMMMNKKIFLQQPHFVQLIFLFTSLSV